MSKFDKFGREAISTAAFFGPGFILNRILTGSKEDSSDINLKRYNYLDETSDERTTVKFDVSDLATQNPQFHLENYENEIVDLISHMNYQSLPENSFSMYKTEELSQEQLNEISFDPDSKDKVQFLYTAQAVMDKVINITKSSSYNKKIINMSNDIIRASKTAFNKEIEFKVTNDSSIGRFEENKSVTTDTIQQKYIIDNKREKQLETYLNISIDKNPKEKDFLRESKSRDWSEERINFVPYTKNKNGSLAADVGSVVKALEPQYSSLSLIGKSIVDRTKNLAKKYEMLVKGSKATYVSLNK
ncbi:hypothetical protein K9L97_00310 [Candidatus Woesearchaeota archaeon]|nr:hypothetical protein [Candidatus Woesearchaeota archaeon]